MTRIDPVAANVAICEALGLDPTSVRKLRLELAPNSMPVVHAELTLYRDGRRYAIDGVVATELKRYRLVLIEDDVS